MARLNFSGQSLSQLDLSYLDLSRANFSQANLSGISFIQSRLKGAKLIEANLSKAELNDADLSAADLFGVNLSEARLSGATLRSTYLVDANLYRASFTEARLPDADLRGARFHETDLSGADLSGVELSGADLTTARLKNGTLPLPDLRGANLYKVRVTPEQYSWLAEAAVNLDGVEIIEPIAPRMAPPAVAPVSREITIRFRNNNELPALSHFLTLLTQFCTKSWLLAQGQLADLLEYQQGVSVVYAQKAGLKLQRLDIGSEAISLTLELAEPALAAALGEAFQSQPASVAAAVEKLVEGLAPKLDGSTKNLVLMSLLSDFLRLSSNLLH